MDAEVKLMLSEWGKWSRQWGFSLGFRPAGDVIGCATPRLEPVLFSDDEMERVGRAVAAIRKTDFEYYEIINDYFRNKKTIRDLSLMYGLSFRKVRDRLGFAVDRVSVELNVLSAAA